jgi:hypothetical protein
LKLCTWFYIYVLQIKFKDGCYWPIFGRVIPVEQKISFLDFFSLCLQIFLWYLVHCFAIPRYRSSLSLVSIHWFYLKLWPLDLEKYHELSVLRTFFLSAYRYSFNICFAIPRYRSSLSLVSIHWFFPKLWPLDFEKYHELSVFRTFFVSAYRYSFDIWFIALPYQFKIQAKFMQVWFWSFRISRNYELLWTFVAPSSLLALQSQIHVVTNQNLVWLCLNYFDWIYRR